MANEVTVEIVFDADTQEIKKVLDKTAKDTEKKGRDAGEGFSSGFSRGLGSLAVAATAAAAALAAVFSGREIIAAASRQQDSINNLNASLSRIGEFSQETSRDLQSFASSLQSITKFGDEAILEQLTFAQSLGASAEQSKEVVAAATNLSAALGIDLQSATRNVARTLGGFAGELGEVIPELRSLSREQLQAGAAVDLLAQKFAGLAEAQTQTFTGALAQAQNSFGDLLERVGAFITSSPALISLFQGIAKALDSIRISSDGDILRPLIDNGIAVARVFSELVLPVFRVFGQSFNLIKELAIGAFATILDGAFAVAGGVTSVLNRLGIATTAVDENIAVTRQALQDLKAEAIDDASDQLVSFGDPTVFEENINLFLETLDNAVAESGAKATLAVEQTNAAVNANIQTTQQAASAAQDRTVASTKKTESALVGLAKRAKGTSKDVQNAFINGIGGAASAGFAALGAAIVNGTNAVEAFGKAVLASIGNALIQEGSAYILTGLARTFFGDPSGPALVGAGAAMATFGGALGAIGGQASGSAASASAGGGGVAASSVGATAEPESEVLTEQSEEDSQPSSRQQITVNVQGDVLDSDESGLRIVELINRNFEREGGTLRDASFA